MIGSRAIAIDGLAPDPPPPIPERITYRDAPFGGTDSHAIGASPVLLCSGAVIAMPGAIGSYSYPLDVQYEY